MAEFIMAPHEAFDAVNFEAGEIAFSAVTGKAIVSAAIPQDGEEAFAHAVRAAYGVLPPVPGKSVPSADGTVLLIGLQRDQIFLLFGRSDDWPERTVADRLDGTAYVTDQSDGWVVGRISGSRCRDALERICRLDIHPDAFAEGSVARTVTEHLNVIILRDGADSFLLMSPGSSALAFRHAVEVSIRNVA